VGRGAPGQPLERLIETWRLGLDAIAIARWLEELVLCHVPGTASSNRKDSIQS
jgi:hypothetical protein